MAVSLASGLVCGLQAAATNIFYRRSHMPVVYSMLSMQMQQADSELEKLSQSLLRMWNNQNKHLRLFMHGLFKTICCHLRRLLLPL